MGWSPARAPAPAPRWNYSNHNFSPSQHSGNILQSREEINVLNDSVYLIYYLLSIIYYIPISTYSSQVAKINASQQIVAPLKMKNRQFLARNLELSARNRQLETGRRGVGNSVSVTSPGQREKERNKIQQKKKLETKIHIKKVREVTFFLTFYTGFQITGRL